MQLGVLSEGGERTGGESIYNGKKFKDDKDALKLKIDHRGVLGMCNTGKNCNSSQFFIALADVNRLTGKHVVRTLTHSTRARHEELLEQ